MSGKRLYIAYGSNLNLPQMARRCPTARIEGITELHDHKLLFRQGSRGSGVATVEPQKGSTVPVVVWSLKARDEISLNRCEGYPTVYGKQTQEVELRGQPVEAMIYTMTPGRKAALPTELYFRTIADGYLSAGFDSGKLEEALQNTEAEMRIDRGRTQFWNTTTQVAMQREAGDPPDLLSALSDESLLYLDNLSGKYGHLLPDVTEGVLDYFVDLMADYAGDPELLTDENMEPLLSLYSSYRNGNLGGDDPAERGEAYLDTLLQGWEYLEGLNAEYLLEWEDDDPNLFTMKMQ